MTSRPAQRPRVLLVDDHPAVLRQAAAVLAGEFEVVDALPDGRTLLEAVVDRRPDLVVLDITLPGRDGLELARLLAAHATPPGVVMLTVHADPDYARAALAAGAAGYVVKSRLATDLVPALRAAGAGGRFLSPILREAVAA
jgi:DNA-binding NarL/FixJ family response regulator